MPDFTIIMSRHYIPQSAGDIVDRIIAAAEEHHSHHGTVPTLCHIPATVTAFPSAVGVLHVEKAKPGELQPSEIDLGVEAER